jgi:GTP:adenosylcobinamide-phosphate guanylyltransferase
MKSIGAVIIQAGGRGRRMGLHTQNKPKCLMPYKGKTILENNLDYFQNKKIIIIIDYLSDVIINYVTNILKREDIIFVKSVEKTTTSGLFEASKFLDENESFIVIWSDLYLKGPIDIDFKKNILIGLTDEFECRWKYKDNKLVKEKTNNDGVLGIFGFKNKQYILNFKEDLSLVGGNLANINSNIIEISHFYNIEEIGDSEKYEKMIEESTKSRFFNKITIKDRTVLKECVDTAYKNLILDEIKWYKFLENKIDFIPKLISEDPFVMEKITGDHIFNIPLNTNQRTSIVEKICSNINELHLIDSCESNKKDVEDIYFKKTFKRVEDVHYIIPFFKNENIKINKKNYLNPFSDKYIGLFQDQLRNITVNKYFTIHGDITFSNLLISNNKAYFIDPRGCFGSSKIYGDKNYDWAKMYYSINGNYDSINQKKFTVNVSSTEALIDIKSNGFESYSDYIIESSGMTLHLMELLHAAIWFSLTGYVKEDIDSILYSFYKGVVIWNRLLK